MNTWSVGDPVGDRDGRTGSSMCRAGRFLLALIALAAPAWYGCSLFGPTDRVQLTLPPTPPVWEPLFEHGDVVRLELRYRDERGRLVRRTVRGLASAVELALPKERVCPVVLVPEVRLLSRETPPGSQELKPAGGVFPQHVDDAGRLRLSWYFGAVAQALQHLEAHAGLGWINVDRLLAEVCERGFADPWEQDTELMAEKLWEENFRESYLRRMEHREMDVSLPSGSWIPTNPYASLLRGAPYTTLSLVPGVHRYLRIDGRRTEGAPIVSVLSIDVPDAGRPVVSLVSSR